MEQAKFPRKLSFLFDPHRYKVVYGGRGGLKSWNFAQALLTLGIRQPLRILCARETQRSIADSVHALLSDWIGRLGLESVYIIQKSEIIGLNGTSFIFSGLREIQNIKSYEGIDIVWVEEAQNVSKFNWERLIPTIRKPGSEIWVSFNPELETDETYRRFVLDPPASAIVCRTTYLDNMWLSAEMRADIEELRQKDYAAYLNVWEGECRSAVEGAIYAEEMKAAETAGRITDVAIDRLRPVDTFWDLGYSDATAIWFAQTFESGQVRIIDYLESRGKTIEWYLMQLQGRGYVYGTDWLPHDGVDAIIHGRLSGDRSRSVEQILRASGRAVRVGSKLHVATGINAARTILANCWFDRERCSEGLRALRSYQWGPKPAGGAERREPLHDWASHGADAFRTLAVCVKYPEPTVRVPDTYQHGWAAGSTNKNRGTGWMGM